jgi:predicted DCC family thiol-disulfide oxidoreductase YuxK
VLRLLQVVLVAALLAATLGVMTRLALLLAAPLYTFWWGWFYSFGAIQHGRLSIVVALAVLAIAPAGAAYSVDAVLERRRRAQPGGPLPEPRRRSDPVAGWALEVVMVFLVIAYLGAAFAKLRTTGLDWPTSGALEALILNQGTGLGRTLVEHGWLVHVMAGAALVLEAGAFVLLFPGRLRVLWLAALAGFHVGSLLLLGINFMPFVITYAAFFRLEQASARAGEAARALGARLGTIEVLYDGQCRLCVRSITVVAALDWLGRLRLIDASATGAAPPDAMYAIDGRTAHRGYRAARRLARALPALWPAYALSFLPGTTPLGDRVYARVAANRGRTGACGVPGVRDPDAAASCALPSIVGQPVAIETRKEPSR